MLQINNLSKIFQSQYKEDTTIFSNLSLNIKEGEFVTIIGSNGTGKSTLLNIVSGVLSQTSGEIILGNKKLTDLKEHKRTQIINRVFQDPSLGTCPSMTVRENLSLALNKGKLTNLGKCVGHKESTLKSILKDVSLDLGKYLDTEVKYLSGGQRQALALIMASVSNPKVLLLDEHTAALDPKTSNEIIKLTDEIVRKKNITTLMVTHNLKHAIEYGDRLIMLHEGKIILDLVGEEKRNIEIKEILDRFEYAI